MNIILDFLKTDNFLLLVFGGIILLLILYIYNAIKLRKISKNYSKFMEKLGNGNNVDEMLRAYIYEVETVSNKNDEIISYFEKLDQNIAKCTQKIGMVRYNAFKDTGSDLSFAVALLNEYNDGIVLNGIYARDMSNIYAKPIEKGQSKYALSEEEKEAIKRAVNQQ